MVEEKELSFVFVLMLVDEDARALVVGVLLLMDITMKDCFEYRFCKATHYFKPTSLNTHDF